MIDKRLIKLSAEPMGIDFQYFHDAIQDINIKKLKRKLEKSFALLKTMISVDRLDYTKGLVNKLQAYETFLSTYPAWRGRVSLILIVAPSREQLSTYQSIKKEVEQYVEQINFRFGTLGWLPVLYRYKSFTAKQLIVLYSLADVALITPLIDGMNLVAKEYVAVKSHAGVLILSETAGAAKELPEAILVNPNRGEEIVLAIKEALEMQKVRQFKALNCMQAYLKKNDVAKWGTRFIHMLLQEKIKQHTLSTQELDAVLEKKLILDFKQAHRRLFLLDYDGTLRGFTMDPAKAKPSPRLIYLIERLSQLTNTRMVIISGRDKNTLASWFKHPAVTLIAEHGAWIKENDTWIQTTSVDVSWKKEVIALMQLFIDKLPGSFLEEKEFSVVWHYRRHYRQKGPMLSKKLAHQLSQHTSAYLFQVHEGDCIIEVKSKEIGKDFAALRLIAQENSDFIFAAGDDSTDEDMFRVIPNWAYSICVGKFFSYARFSILSVVKLIRLLERLASDETIHET